MALDERQKQIQTQAGLEESRLNTDFIDFLKKYSSIILTIILAIVVAYVGYGKLRESRASKLGDAFAQYESARKASSPTNLRRVADEFTGQVEIGSLSRLDAADVMLTSAIKGLVPGAVTDRAKGTVTNPEDILTADARAKLLADAKALYERVVTDTQGDPLKATLTIGAMFGVAAVAETTANADEAKAMYAKIEQLATAANLPDLAGIAKSRAADVQQFLGGVKLMSADEVKTKPAPPPPPAPIPAVKPELDFPPSPLLPVDQGSSIAPGVPVTPAAPAAPANPANPG